MSQPRLLIFDLPPLIEALYQGTVQLDELANALWCLRWQQPSINKVVVSLVHAHKQSGDLRFRFQSGDIFRHLRKARDAGRAFFADPTRDLPETIMRPDRLTWEDLNTLLAAHDVPNFLQRACDSGWQPDSPYVSAGETRIVFALLNINLRVIY